MDEILKLEKAGTGNSLKDFFANYRCKNYKLKSLIIDVACRENVNFSSFDL